MVPVPVWLAAYPHGAYRFKNAAGQRRRSFLPPAAWLLERLQSHNMSLGLREAYGDDVATLNSVTLLGLMFLLPCVAWTGPLTHLSSEAAVMREYFGFPCDGFTVQIRDFIAL